MFHTKSSLKNSPIFTGKLWWSLFFNKVAELRACNFINKRLQRSCFSVKFAKFLWTPFFTKHPWWLLPSKRLTLKKLGGGRRGQFDLPPPCGFSKNISSEEMVKFWFFVTFNIIIRQIFPENLIEVPQVVQKIWRLSLSILAISSIFNNFLDFLTIPCYKEINDIGL